MSGIHLPTEYTPLLVRKPSQYDEEDEEISTAHEARVLVGLSLPLICMNFLRFTVQTSTIFAVSRLGTRELAASNLGLLTSNVLGFAILLGLISGLDSLANQAAKSHSPTLTSIYCMRTFVVSCQAMPVLFLLLWNTNTIFRWILPNADPQMLRLASDYCKVTSFALPPLAALECIRRYCQAFGKVAGPAIGYSLAAPISVFFNWLLVFGPDNVRIGYLGAPAAVVIAYTFLFLTMLVYAWVAAPRHAWAGVSKTIFQDLGVNWQYGIAGVLSTVSEWYAFEAISLGSTYLGEVTQATSAILATIGSLAWQTPLALSMAVSIRVGNLIGAGKPQQAKKAAWTAQVFALSVVLTTAILIFIFRRSFATMFSQDPAVIAQADRCMILASIIALGDGIQGSSTGILRGIGLPGLAANINLMSYWVLGLPIGAYVTWRTLDVAALWTGLAIAVSSAAILMNIFILRNDWEKRAEEALERMADSDEYTRLSDDESEDERLLA